MFSQLSFHDIGIIVLSMVISLACHEAMHAFTAHSLGDTTASEQGRLTLNPLRHIDIMTTVLLPIILLSAGLPPIFIAKPVPFNPHMVRYGEYGAALVALAGPFTNLILAALGSLLIHFVGPSAGLAYGIEIFMQVNIAFFVFNMIPLPPLDGSRLLYAFAPDPVKEVMARIESLGLWAILILYLVLLPLIAPILGKINDSIFTFLLR